MNISGLYSLHDIIREVETVLQIDGKDFEERDIDVIIKNVKMRIGRQHQIDLTNATLDSTSLEIGPYRMPLSIFLDNATRLHSKLCGYCGVMRYQCQKSFDLGDINYLGFVEEDLKSILVRLQRRVTMSEVEPLLKAIKNKLGMVNLCWEKRLFIIMIVAYELGLKEISASVAEILYLNIVR